MNIKITASVRLRLCNIAPPAPGAWLHGSTVCEYPYP